jgi:hypothetical protein
MSKYVKSRTTPVQRAISTVNNTVDAIARNPVPAIEATVLTAVLTPYLGPTGASAASSAAVTYLNGGSPEDAAKAGAISYGSATVAETYAPAAQKPDNIDVGGGFNPATGAGDPTTAAAAAAAPTAAEKSAVQKGTSSALRAADKKKSGEEILAAGLIGGASGYGGTAVSEELGLTPGSAADIATKTVVGQSITDYLTPTRSAQTVGGGGYVPTSVTTTGAGQAPGSQALAQALRIGDAGAPIFGGDKEDKGKQSGWNVESLRYMGQES